MKAYRLVVSVVDFDELGAEGIKDTLENVKYPNWCMSPHVVSIEGVDVGVWDDDHPLNQGNTNFEVFFAAAKKLAWLKEQPEEDGKP